MRKAKGKGPSKSTSSSSLSSQLEKPQVKESYRSATGVLISRPRALDVKIGGFTLAAYGKELIKDTMIELTIGRRYGLISSNGAGKVSVSQMSCGARSSDPRTHRHLPVRRRSVGVRTNSHGDCHLRSAG